MVFGGFELIMEACSQTSFPALRLAVKLNLKYPIWFDENFPQNVLQNGATQAGQVREFCKLWQQRDNFSIPLVLEIARKDGLDDFVQVAEDALVRVFKTPNVNAAEWEAMEILFEHYMDNLAVNKFYDEHEQFLTKMSKPMDENGEQSKAKQRKQAERQRKAVENVIEHNYYHLLRTIVFKGELEFRLVHYQVITMTEKHIIDNSSKTPQGHARYLLLNFIRKRPEKWNAFIAALRECFSAENLATILTKCYNQCMEQLAYDS